ncbi:MAG: HAD family phosphatase [Thermomicrobiales bacterium]|nr:HAD family phosphatase [Thermomicrobiales bacterium]
MTQPVRLSATDLDGTLLRSDRTVSQRTRATIARAQAAGIIFVIATARHPQSAQHFADLAGISGLAICTNGAIVYDLAESRIVEHTHLPAETARALIETLRAALPGIAFAFVRGMDFACEPGYALLAASEDHGRDFALVPQDDGVALLAQPATKLIVRHGELSPPELFQHVRSIGLDGFEASLSGAPFLDVVAAGVSKAAALASICSRLAIERTAVVAFGDAPNDLPMLQWAGRPIAVANAYPEVHAVVPERTESNNDDGVALAIERLLA